VGNFPQVFFLAQGHYYIVFHFIYIFPLRKISGKFPENFPEIFPQDIFPEKLHHYVQCCQQDLFSRPRPRPFFRSSRRLETKTMSSRTIALPRSKLSCQDQDQDQCLFSSPRGASKPKACPRGLQHCLRVSYRATQYFQTWAECLIIYSVASRVQIMSHAFLLQACVLASPSLSSLLYIQRQLYVQQR
jgi:hypothetical protein